MSRIFSRGVAGSLLAVFLTVGLWGCSKDDPSPYDFNGTWVASYQVVVSNAGYIPVGLTSTGTVVIDQNDVDLVVTLGTGFPMAGTCDPLLKTFSVADEVGATQRLLSGQAENKKTLSGTLTLNKSQEQVILSWTMELVSRLKDGDAPAGCAAANPVECPRAER